jgi:hypothetical protein
MRDRPAPLRASLPLAQHSRLGPPHGWSGASTGFCPPKDGHTTAAVGDALRQAYDAERSRLDALVRQFRAALREQQDAGDGAATRATTAVTEPTVAGASGLSDPCPPSVLAAASSEAHCSDACPAALSGAHSDGSATVTVCGATTVDTRLLALERQKLEADRALEAVHSRMASRTRAAAAVLACEPTPAELAQWRLQQRDEDAATAGSSSNGSTKPQLASPGVRRSSSFTHLGSGASSAMTGRAPSLALLKSPSAQAAAGGDFRGSTRSITSAFK